MILFSFYRFFNQISLRFYCQHFENIMENLLKPPENVYLMPRLNKSAFEKCIKVPVLNVGDLKVSSILPLVKKFLLKVENFKPIKHVAKENVCVYLNPEVIKKWSDLPEEIRKELESFNIKEEQFKLEDLMLKYENFNAESILRAVLPKDKEGVSSFTKVGHIVHVNLREHLAPYKGLIGEVLFDKVKGCESVVNKINMIDNTYRNFKMEVLKGVDNMHTTVKENNCRFEFDFSTVYWNSRLCTEHERVVKFLKPDDVFFDVFAGVGPFSIPAAKKKSIVYANDLNPESFKWLKHNKTLNKISDQCFNSFNLDGRQFISEVIKENLPKYIKNHRIVIAMNLPAMAVEFLDSFKGLFTIEELPENFNSITLYVYCFSKGENPEEIALKLIQENLKVENIKSKISEIFRVRTVSSMKEMMRVTLSLDSDILVEEADNSKRKNLNQNGGVVKKMCIDVDDQNGQKQQEKDQCCFQSGRSQEFENEIKGESCEK